MQNYPLRVVSRRLMLIAGLSLIGIVFLFPTKPVEMHGSSARPEQTLVLRKVAYAHTTSFISGSYTEVYTANEDGTGQTRLALGFDPAWSPDGSKIVFRYGDIYVMNPDGTNQINLTNSPQQAIHRNPSWSVTGKIAYERGGRIWVMNADGTNQAPFPGITQPTSSSPAWSPDGSQLAFANGSGDIWVINADGTGERRIAIGQVSLNAPAWSPDGLKIVYSKLTQSLPPSQNYYLPGIVVSNADGTNEMILTRSQPVNGADTNPAWSSDGSKIAFDRYGTGVDDGIYVMNPDGTNPIRILVSGPGLHVYNPAWRPFPALGGPRFDFDGDNKADFAVYNPGDSPTAQSYWHVLRSSNNSYFSVQFGSGEDKIVPADYNGDGSTDVAVFRPSTGTWYTSLDSSTGYGAVQWGISGDIPIPGDFDGDGIADHAVYRPSDGVWYILNSSDGSFVGRQFGTATDQPLLLDYDGDRKTDLAFLRSVGRDYYWYILQSSNNTAVVPRLGVAGDKAVPADYDGDGRSNPAVYKRDTRTWIILNASGNGTVEQQWGQSGDLPAPADFDGDGKADFTIFRADGAIWAVLRSGDGGIVSQQWGNGASVPVNTAYIP